MSRLSRWSKREYLLSLAKKLKIKNVPLSISDNELQNLIDRQPATFEQTHIISEFLKPLGKEAPYDLTFGQARKAIEAIREDLNRYSVEVMKLEEGQIRYWEGKYFYIEHLLGDAFNHMLVSVNVNLSRNNKGELTITPTGKSRKVHPADMLYVSAPVDPDTWQPESSTSSFTGNYPDDDAPF